MQREHSIPFKQLLVKEILVNGPWRLITRLAEYVTVFVFLLIPKESFSHETIQKRFSMDGHALINQDKGNGARLQFI